MKAMPISQQICPNNVHGNIECVISGKEDKVVVCIHKSRTVAKIINLVNISDNCG